jgi:hypothetical protein
MNSVDAKSRIKTKLATQLAHAWTKSLARMAVTSLVIRSRLCLRCKRCRPIQLSRSNELDGRKIAEQDQALRSARQRLDQVARPNGGDVSRDPLEFASTMQVLNPTPGNENE